MKQPILKAALCLSFFSLIVSESLIAATSLDSASDIRSSSISLQKPRPMSALNWIQHLEDERDKADIDGNYAGFKKLTDEISATIAGKYGISKRSATQEEQITIIHSITRTRHRFMGQRNMLHDRYLGYDRAKTNSLLQTESLFKNHMAAVLAVDAMVMKAMNDDDFEELWRQENADKTASTVFVAGVIDHAKGHEKKEVLEQLQPHFQRFLQARHDIIYIANDVFSVFAPKMTLQRIYSDVMVSGGVYKGWTVHGVDAFARLVTLTEDEKLVHPELETGLMQFVMRSLSQRSKRSFFPIFFSSSRGKIPSDEQRSRVGIISEDMVIEYIYKDSLLGDIIDDLRDEGTRIFYLSRPVKPFLINIIERRHGVIPREILLSYFKNPLVNCRMGAECGIIPHLEIYASAIFNGLGGVLRDIPKAVKLMKEAADLGSPSWCGLNLSGGININAWALFMNAYALGMFYGEHGIERNVVTAIELLRFAYTENEEVTKKNLGTCLHNYAVKVFYGKDGIEKDMSRAIEVMRESASLKDQSAIKNLPIFINDYAVDLYCGHNGVTVDIPNGIELLREAAQLGNQNALNNLREFLHDYAAKLFNGEVVERDIPKSIELDREALRLGNLDAERALGHFLSDYAINLFYGREGIERNIPRAFENMREAVRVDCDRNKKNLSLMLENYSAMLFYGKNGLEIDYINAIEAMRESIAMGSGENIRNLSRLLHDYGVFLFKGENGVEKNIYGYAVD